MLDQEQLYLKNRAMYTRSRDANFYLTHPFLDLVPGQSASWQTAHERVGGVVWWTSIFVRPCSSKKVRHTVKQRCILFTSGYFLKLIKAYTPCNTLLLIIFACLSYQVLHWLQAWRFLSKSWIKAEFIQSPVGPINAFSTYCVVVPWLVLGEKSSLGFLILSHCLKNTGQD